MYAIFIHILYLFCTTRSSVDDNNYFKSINSLKDVRFSMFHRLNKPDGRLEI